MDAFLGSWKLQFDRTEGPLIDLIKAMEIPEQFVEMFAKAVYTIAITKDGDQYTYSFTMEGASETHVAGPFKLGDTFTFYDNFCKRTEEITVTHEGSKSKEVTVIKEKPSIVWTIYRYLEGGEMITETECGGLKSKAYLKKV